MLQFYVAFLTFIVVGGWVDANPDLADEVSVWTGGGVWPAALGAWIAIGKAFDKLYPPPDGEDSPLSD
ncbi:hypothetical protein [Nonomuraea longicatena]|uniref:Holin n=1 Tax=Nonomuraea longicatena TaxID=83682 RepID=A0ABP4AFC7_9ACTN